MQFYSLTDRGKLRESNEDCCLAKQTDSYTLLILADGMGGHRAGEVASSKTIEAVSSYIEEHLSKNLIPAQIFSILSQAVENANATVYDLSAKDSALLGMGTTLDVCIIIEDTAYIAHIGDGRVYKITAQKELSLLTKDHSLVSYMIETGAITPEEAMHHPQKNVITRALGTSLSAEADIFQVKMREGDRLLLCSDGLSNMLDDETILKVMCRGSLDKCAQKLVDLANNAGGTDNITVVLSQY